MDALRTRKLPFSKKRLPKKVVLSYILDYVIIVVLIGGFYLLDAVEPYHQHFSLQNYTLHYPYATKERVPVPELVVIAVGAPALIIAFYTLVIDGFFSHHQPTVSTGLRRRLTGRYRLKDRLWELNCGLLGLALAVGAAFTITGTLKNAIGKPRPDLIDRCQPPADAEDPKPFGLSSHSICTQTDNAILKDGFRSFPSGHSSTAFAGLFYLSIYLAAKMHVLDSKGEVWKSFIILIPTLGAALIAGSRIMDARHHPFDVLSGSLLGILVAWGSYRQYFPPVSETWHKGRAYPIRSWGKSPPPPGMAQVPSNEDLEPLRDEEATHAASSTAIAEHNGNVFRAQVSQSQRHRDLTRNESTSTYGHSLASSHTGPHRAPTNLTYTSQLPSSNPYRDPTNRIDEWDESSSEDDANFEMRPTYTFSEAAAAPKNNVATGYGVVPGVGTGEDTTYHTPAQPATTGRSLTHGQEPPVSPYVVEGERSNSLPRRPVGTEAGDERRGVQLVDRPMD